MRAADFSHGVTDAKLSSNGIGAASSRQRSGLTLKERMAILEKARDMKAEMKAQVCSCFLSLLAHTGA